MSILGLTHGMVPSEIDGRGLVKLDGTIFEFQTALAYERDLIPEYIKNLNEQYKAYGKAKKLPITSETKAKRTPNTKPNIVISFISPPPNDSCLKALSPKNLIVIINININKPLITEIINVLDPK